MFVVGKNPEILLDSIMKNLGITYVSDSLRRQFLKAAENCREAIIRQAYVENSYYEDPWDNIILHDIKNI